MAGLAVPVIEGAATALGPILRGLAQLSLAGQQWGRWVACPVTRRKRAARLRLLLEHCRVPTKAAKNVRRRAVRSRALITI